MDVPFSGGCACSMIRYECTGQPKYMGNCHCRDCQRATGTAYFPAILVLKNDFSITAGEPSWFESLADKGHPMKRAFCPSCGSPLFLINGSHPNARVLYAGSLDDPSCYAPSRDIYVSSAQPWDVLDPDIPKHAFKPEIPKR